jgi:hypothetical protein
VLANQPIDTRVGPVLILLALLASACGVLVTSPPDNIRGEITGSPGPDVTVYEFSNAEYFEEHPGGIFTIRPAYQNTIGIVCDTGWGRSCSLGVGVPKGSACTCKTVWGPISGHAS